jgi:hypothetical protein
MATEISREFDVEHGRVVLTVKDALGNVSVHSIYVTGPSGVKDVAAAIALTMMDTDKACADLQAALETAGWQPNGN